MWQNNSFVGEVDYSNNSILGASRKILQGKVWNAPTIYKHSFLVKCSLESLWVYEWFDHKLHEALVRNGKDVLKTWCIQYIFYFLPLIVCIIIQGMNLFKQYIYSLEKLQFCDIALEPSAIFQYPNIELGTIVLQVWVNRSHNLFHKPLRYFDDIFNKTVFTIKASRSHPCLRWKHLQT